MFFRSKQFGGSGFYRLRYLLPIIFLVSFLLTFCLGGTITARCSSSASEVGVRLPIHMYHIVSPQNTYRFGVTPDELESDLNYLVRNGYTAVTMTDLIDYAYSGRALPQKPVVLSFDDGYYNNYVYAYPLLKKYRTKAVLSIIGKSTDDFSSRPSENLSYAHVTWAQLNEMTASGLVEVQNHTYNLHEINGGRTGCMRKPGETPEHYEKILTEDVGKLQDEIAAQTGFTPNTFVYPYGKSSGETDAILKKLGFRATLSCDYGVSVLSGDPDGLFGLRRIERTHVQSAESILKNN